MKAWLVVMGYAVRTLEGPDEVAHRFEFPTLAACETALRDARMSPFGSQYRVPTFAFCQPSVDPWECAQADLTGDGFVTAPDRTEFDVCWGARRSVPVDE